MPSQAVVGRSLAAALGSLVALDHTARTEPSAPLFRGHPYFSSVEYVEQQLTVAELKFEELQVPLKTGAVVAHCFSCHASKGGDGESM